MSKAAALALSLTVQGDGQNTAWAPTVAITNAASPGGSQQIALSSGANTITVPTGAIGFVYVPPSSSGVSKTLKGVSGDTGLPMATAIPTPYDWEGAASPPATFVITAASSETGTMYWV